MATYKNCNHSNSKGPTRPDFTFKFNCEPVVEIEEPKKKIKIIRAREPTRPMVYCRHDGETVPVTPEPVKESCRKIIRPATRPNITCINDKHIEDDEISQDKKNIGPRFPTRPNVTCRRLVVVEEAIEEKQSYKQIGQRPATRPNVSCRKKYVPEPEQKLECCKTTIPSQRRKINVSC
jgi:hypothetical protein